VDHPPVPPCDAEDERSVHVTDHGTVTTGKAGSHKPTSHTEQLVSDREDAAVNRVESSGSHAMANRASPDPDRQQLVLRDDPVLPERELRYLALGASPRRAFRLAW
jgi:hypothetical protein